MKTTLHLAETRGSFDFGWLRTHHSFSFGSYKDLKKMHFGALRVLNDDYVKAGEGFPTHPHDNMEIVTLVLKGSLKHKDSMGTASEIKTGEVQRMSAGTGITHSEFNGSESEDLNLLQIWIYPKTRNMTPSYEQKLLFSPLIVGRRLLVSPSGESDSVHINQDAYFTIFHQLAGKNEIYNLYKNTNQVYFFVIDGEVKIEEQGLKTRDAYGIEDFNSAEINFVKTSTLLVIEVPPFRS